MSSKPSNPPGWRRAFDTVARRVEGGVRTDAFNDAMTVVFRARRGLQRAVERQMRSALHHEVRALEREAEWSATGAKRALALPRSAWRRAWKPPARAA